MNLVWFLLLIVVLVTVHELGHLVAAWLFRVRVVRVGIGLGPVLVRRTFRRTEYVVGAFPIGGYVKLLGEDGEDADDPVDAERTFHRRPLWQRLVIILGGPIANIAFAIGVFLSLATDIRSAPSSEVGWVTPGLPAADADIRAGDRVVAVDGAPVRFWSDVQAIIGAAAGREVRVTVERPGEARPLTKYVTPRSRERVGLFGGHERVGVLGIAPERRLPRIGVLAGSPAYAAGLRTFDVVTAIQGRAVKTVRELDQLLKPRSGTMSVVTVLRSVSTDPAMVGRMQPFTVQLVPSATVVEGKTHYELGIRPADLFVYAVDERSAAAKAGIGRGDLLLAFDGTALDSWEQLQRLYEEHPRESHRLRIRAASGEERDAIVQLERQREVDEYHAESTQWTLGIVPGRASAPVAEEPLEPPLLAALRIGLGQVAEASSILVRALFATLFGDLPASSLGGPLFVYEVAGVAASHGADAFLRMAAVLSINLGLLNLLPIPMLDGGQAALGLYEAVRRRRVSPAQHRRFAYAGVSLLVVLLAFASINDLVRRFWR